MTLPVLYSFRRCPYAIRARLAILVSGLEVELREVVLRDKPAEMLLISPKATLPVLSLLNQKVIDESLDIMYWALSQHDPDQWLFVDRGLAEAAKSLIQENDGAFKTQLDRYKYASRFPERSVESYRNEGEGFILKLEQRLQLSEYIMSPKFSIVDAAILPFVRQFAHVDKQWFDQAPYPFVRKWLYNFLESPLFSQVMLKYKQWVPDSELVTFGKHWPKSI